MNIEMIEQASNEIAEYSQTSHCSIEFLQECFHLCKETGSLTWKTRPANHFKTKRDCNAWNTLNAGKKAGVQKQSGRIELTIKNRKYRAHRVVWALSNGYWPGMEIDHKDCDPSNNTPANLRPASRLQNQRNRKLSTKNTSGFKGVTWFSARNKFKAQIKVNEKCIYLGLFDDPEKAHQAYCKAANQLYGEFANYGH